MKLFNKKIKIDDAEFVLIINKIFYATVSGKDYYIYECELFKEKYFLNIIKYKKCVYIYNTYWLNYFKYSGNIDKVIDECIILYKRNTSEQKYISNRESIFKSKYEV